MKSRRTSPFGQSLVETVLVLPLLLILLGTLIFFALLVPNLERPGFYIKGYGAYYPAVGRNLARR